VRRHPIATGRQQILRGNITLGIDRHQIPSEAAHPSQPPTPVIGLGIHRQLRPCHGQLGRHPAGVRALEKGDEVF
jgi:hypothetical protein